MAVDGTERGTGWARTFTTKIKWNETFDIER